MGIRNRPLKNVKMINFQVKMPEELIRLVQEEMKKENYKTWQEFLIASFEAYLKAKKEGEVGERE